MYSIIKKPPLVLKQPPLPICIHREDGSPLCKIKEEEYNTENCSNQTRPYYFRRCKRKRITITSIESLPDELIFEILVRVPAEDIYNNATWLVCRKWYKIVHTHDFIHAHLHQSKFGFLTQGNGHNFSFLARGKGLTTEKSKINYTFDDEVMSSCNGLVLELHDNSYDICITNPTTQQNFALPPFFSNIIMRGFAIAYAATSMEYKVVRAFSNYNPQEPCSFASQEEHVAIYTVGIDKDWTRRVNTRHLSLAVKRLFLSQEPFTTEGFVHWAQNDSRSKYVLTLNIETEVFSQFALPLSLLHPHDGENELINYYYLPMGNDLSLLIERSKFSWEFWEMKPETGEWAKLPNVDLEAQFARNKNCTLTPGGWLKFREVLIFSLSFEKIEPLEVPSSCTRHFISCNVRTSEFRTFELNGGTLSFLAHRNSLVWMGKR